MGVQNISSADELKKILADNSSKLVVIDFFAEWCGPCKMIAPKMEVFSKEFPEVVFVKIDVDLLEDVAADKGVSAMPTFHFMKGGSKVDELVGANEAQLKGLIVKHK